MYILETMLNKRVRKVGRNGDKKILPIYDFENSCEISIFGDIEGAFPFTDIPEKHKLKIPFRINIDKNISIKLQNNKAFVFTGDLIDKSKHDIRWLNTICAAKSTWEDKVLLGIGNRDINKLRMIDESFMTVHNYAADNRILPWEVDLDVKSNFEDLCKKIMEGFNNYSEKKGHYVCSFSFKDDDIINKYIISKEELKSIQSHTPNDDKYPKLFAKDDIGYDTLPGKNTFQDGLERIKDIYSNTLGASDVYKNRWQELFELGYVKDDRVNDNVKYIALAITNMMMTLIWPEEYIESKCKNKNIKELFKYLNGLHIKYLQNAHIIGKITKKGKNYIFSHSGIPDILSAPLGYSQTDNNYGQNVKQLDEILIEIENEKKDFINIFDIKSNKNISKNITADKIIEYINKEILVNDKLYKYIQLSAPTGYKIKDNNVFGSINSPIVLQYTGYLKKGGGKIFKNTNNIKYCKRDSSIHYNIFGHQPQGYFPTAIYNNDGTYDICLDISSIKYENGFKEGSYAFMYINNSGEITINGRIVNSNSSINNILENKDNKIIYTKKLYSFQTRREEYNINNKDIDKCRYYVNKNKSLKLKYELLTKPPFTSSIEKIKGKENRSQSRGRKKSLKPTSNKIKVGKLYRKVYIGPRGGKYIKYKGEYTSIKSLDK